MGRIAICVALATAVCVGAAAAQPRESDERSLRLGGTPLALIAAKGSLWALTCEQRCSGEARRSAGRIIRIDPRTARIKTAAPIDRPGAIAVAADGVFATDFWRDSVRRLNPMTLRETSRLKLVLPAEIRPRGGTFLPNDLALGGGAVWVSTEWCALARVDRRLRRVDALVRLPCDAYQAMVVGGGAVWISESLAGLYRIDASSHRVVARIRIGAPARRLIPTRVFFSHDGVLATGPWTQGNSLTSRNAFARINPSRNRAAMIRPLPDGPLAVAFGEGSLWVGRIEGSSVERIDPTTGRLLGRLSVPVGVALAVSGHKLWTATRAGTLRQLAVL